MKRSIAVEKLQRGRPLVFEHDQNGVGHYYLAGHYLPEIQAKALIRDLEMIHAGDVLFDGMEPQTWRLPCR